jgi:hypothetical protein
VPDWDIHLPFSLHAIRTTVHKATGKTPFELLYGRKARGVADEISSPSRLPYYALDEDYAQEMTARMSLAYKEVDELRDKTVDKYLQHFNKGRKLRELQVGDIVDKTIDVHKSGEKKFGKRWTGKYEVTERLGEVTYLIRDLHTRKIIKTHVNKLKLVASDKIFDFSPSKSSEFANKGDPNRAAACRPDHPTGSRPTVENINSKDKTIRNNFQLKRAVADSSESEVDGESFSDSSESSAAGGGAGLDSDAEREGGEPEVQIPHQVEIEDAGEGSSTGGGSKYNLRNKERRDYTLSSYYK